MTRPSHEYSPRACDCDFCVKHGASYLSDPKGSLVIDVNDGRLLRRYRLGSGTAEMLLCGNCGVLVGGIYQAEEAGLFAAINSKIIDGGVAFAEARTVSPQTLSSGEKTARWQQLWFANVTLNVPVAPAGVLAMSADVSTTPANATEAPTLPPSQS